IVTAFRSAKLRGFPGHLRWAPRMRARARRCLECRSSPPVMVTTPAVAVRARPTHRYLAAQRRGTRRPTPVARRRAVPADSRGGVAIHGIGHASLPKAQVGLHKTARPERPLDGAM